MIEVATGKVVSADPFVPSDQLGHGLRQGEQLGAHPQSGCQLRQDRQGFVRRALRRRMSGHPQSYNPNTGLIYVGIPLWQSVIRVPRRAPGSGQPAAWMSTWRSSRNASLTRPVLKDARRLPYGLGSGEAEGGVDAAPGQRQRRHADHGRQPGVPGHVGQKLHGYSAPTRASKIWSTPTQGNVVPGPMSYSIDGVQYVAAVSSASTGFAAANGDQPPAGLQARRQGDVAAGAAAGRAGAQSAGELRRRSVRKRGQEVYERSCTGCHEGGRMFTGFPDLSYTRCAEQCARCSRPS